MFHRASLGPPRFRSRWLRECHSVRASALSHTHTTTSSAPTASAAAAAPSSTRCGSASSRVRSFRLPGSPSDAVDDHYRAPALPAPRARIFSTVGKPPPPRPRSPAGRAPRSAPGRSRRVPAQGGISPWVARWSPGSWPPPGGRPGAVAAGSRWARRRGCSTSCSSPAWAVRAALPEVACEDRLSEQRCRRPGTARPVLRERAARQPDRQEQRERRGAAERRAVVRGAPGSRAARGRGSRARPISTQATLSRAARRSGVAARAETVEQRDRPAGVGQPMRGAPGAVAEPARSRLVRSAASRRSKETAPRPSQNGR